MVGRNIIFFNDLPRHADASFLAEVGIAHTKPLEPVGLLRQIADDMRLSFPRAVERRELDRRNHGYAVPLP
jgi:hypothetical protein